MTKQQFKALIADKYLPVVLLEGRRKVKEEDASSLTNFAEKLVNEFSSIMFRTGNADGSDTLFAKGVGAVDASRIQYVVPYENMKKANRVDGASVLSYDRVNDSEGENIQQLTAQQGKKMAQMVDYARRVPKGRIAAKAQYLLRDTLKVTGSDSAGFEKPVVAFFYIDPADKYAGGTGHTIKVCEQLGVHVITQDVWMKWY
ncbi:MAG: hypothetical protein LAT67_05525 [Balneolales bacterium]|nr:hypothetical protein [Balneolales bacterium]